MASKSISLGSKRYMQSTHRYFTSFATRRNTDNRKRDTFPFSGGLTKELCGIKRNAPYILKFYKLVSVHVQRTFHNL